jgi:predicted nucleotidyltransferase
MTEPDLGQLSDRLKQWSANAVDGYGAKSVHLFGSLIHKGGVQFNESSDIDLALQLHFGFEM